MSFIPDEEMQTKTSLNLTPMVDFLFLVVAVFATLAITRNALHDTEVDLAKLNAKQDASVIEQTNQKYHDFFVNVSITKSGEYKWLSETSELSLSGIEDLKQQVANQQELGLLPKENSHIKILLHIDKNAPWEPIAQAILGVKEMGLDIHPVYESK